MSTNKTNAAAPAVPQDAPTVPESVMTYIHAYGDSRADDDGLSALRIMETVIALRAWAAQVRGQAEPQAAPRALPDRDALIDIIAKGIGGLLGCGRAWSAWSAGAMGEDDFYPAAETDAPSEIADAILAAAGASEIRGAAPEPVVTERPGDWNSDATLTVTQDGDHVRATVHNGKDGTATIEFGHKGRSPRTRAALLALAEAMRADAGAAPAVQAGAPKTRIWVNPLADELDALHAEVESLRAALKWYAEGHHFGRGEPDAWDTVSGEPQNWWCDEAGTATIEDGSLAGEVLAGRMTGHQLFELDDGDEAPSTTLVAQPLTPPFDFAAHLRRQAEFSSRTFGPGARVEGVTDHIAKELIEVRESGGALAEWIDVVILGLDGCWRSGASPEQIIAAMAAKQAKNEARTWPDWRTMPTDRAIEHDRTGEEAPAAPQAAPDTSNETDAFETWVQSDSTLPVTRNEHGYTDMTTALLWHAWQARAALAAAGAPATVPAGWALVPAEPTVGMCIAGDEARMNVDDATRTPAVYRAMLAAAPKAPATVQPVPEPVAWANPSGGYLSANYMRHHATGLERETYTIPLYSKLPPATVQPLTDEARDAQRYRWLREGHGSAGAAQLEEAADKGWERVNWLYDEDLDTVIDAEMAAKEGGAA